MNINIKGWDEGSGMSDADWTGAGASKGPLDTVHELVEEIEQDIDERGLEKSQVSLDVDLDINQYSADIEYTVETMEWVEELDSVDPARFRDSYRVVPEKYPLDKRLVKETLYDNFVDSAIRVNGEIVREALSPEYDAF